jgi:hypothetical protein
MAPGLGEYIGEQQTLTYGGTTITLTNDNFKPVGSGWLAFIGYDRQIDTRFLPEIGRSNLGQAFWTGRAHTLPYVFAWELQLLTEDQAWGLYLMSQNQQVSKLPARLVDERLKTLERAPRVRAKKGTVDNKPDNMLSFWGQYNVFLRCDIPPVRVQNDWWELSIRGVEMDVVALANDL